MAILHSLTRTPENTGSGRIIAPVPVHGGLLPTTHEATPNLNEKLRSPIFRKRLALWHRNERPLIATPTDRVLYGVIPGTWTPKHGLSVFAFDRNTGQLAGTDTTDPAGAFVIIDLSPDTQYLVAAVPPTADPPTHNAAILDLITPSPQPG